MDKSAFSTEVINCFTCYKHVRYILSNVDENIVVNEITTDGKKCFIIAGRIKNIDDSISIEVFENEIIPELEMNICHPIKICLMTKNSGDKLYKIEPKG
jgi:hypothetical protein